MRPPSGIACGVYYEVVEYLAQLALVCVYKINIRGNIELGYYVRAPQAKLGAGFDNFLQS